jgi:hypothetical protein
MVLNETYYCVAAILAFGRYQQKKAFALTRHSEKK